MADRFADRPGLEMVFPGTDGRIHAVDASGSEIWAWTYTTQDTVLTGGVVIGDLSGNGIPEMVVSLMDAEDRIESALLYTVPGSADNCLLWPTGRGNLPRNGWVLAE